MTGYAVIDKDLGHKKIRLHLKSVNNRFFDLKWRAPKSWVGLEIEFKNQLKKAFQRGSFEFWVEEIREQNDRSDNNAQNYLNKLNEALLSIKGISKLSIPSFVRATILAKNPELWFKSHEQAVNSKDLSPVFEELILEFTQVRVTEGEKLCSHLLEISSDLEKRFTLVQKRLPELRNEFQEESRKKLEALFEQFSVGESEKSKIASEIALQIDKRDCSEELQRIEMHLAAFKTAINQHQSNLGKRLDFIAQELNREWNTLGSKARIQEIFQNVLEAKLEIEKIREQCLNLA